MRIVIVSQYYHPESVGLPVTLARGLRERGHHVEVVTGYPNYPSGRIFAGYKQKLRCEENHEGVRVRRVPLVIGHSANPWGRVASYVSFAVSSAFVGHVARNADAVYVYAPQMTASFGPWLWRRRWGTPFVLHVQDVWPESITGSSLVNSRVVKSLVGAILTPWLSRVYAAASAVVVIAPSMGTMLENRGAPRGDTHVVYNWATEERCAVSESARVRTESTGTRVTFAGNLGVMQDLETVVRAAALVSDLDNFEIRFVGTGIAEPSLRKLVGALHLDNVEFCPRVPVEEMADVYASSDFELVCLKDLEIFDGTIPSKLQSSLVHGVPVITTVRGDTSRLVADNNLGFVARPEDPVDLARVFRRVAALNADERSALARRTRSFYERHLSEDRAISRIESVLEHASSVVRNARNARNASNARKLTAS